MSHPTYCFAMLLSDSPAVVLGVLRFS
jgi:hypothetical protein